MKAKKRTFGKYDAKKLHWLHTIRNFIVLVVAVFLVFRFCIGFSIVDGVSMRDTLQKGELVLYTRIHGTLQRGDIVAISLPNGEHYVKRIVALGGDVVDIHDGKLYINGVEEDAEYAKGQTFQESNVLNYPYTVKLGDYFTIGDNREQSTDSRYYGAVSEKEISGIMKIGFSFETGFQWFD